MSDRKEAWDKEKRDVENMLRLFDRISKRVDDVPDYFDAVSAETGEPLPDWDRIEMNDQMKRAVASIAVIEKQSITVAAERFFARAIREFVRRRSVLGALEESKQDLTNSALDDIL